MNMANKKRPLSGDDDFGDVSLSPLRSSRSDAEERAGLAQDDDEINQQISRYLNAIAHMQDSIENGISENAVQNFQNAMANVFGPNLIQQGDVRLNNITPAGRKYFVANQDKLQELLADTIKLIGDVANFKNQTDSSAETTKAMWGLVKEYENKVFKLSVSEKVKLAVAIVLGAIAGAISLALAGSLAGPAVAVGGAIAGIILGGLAGWQGSNAVLFKREPLRQAIKDHFIAAFNEEIGSAIEVKTNYKPGSVDMTGGIA